MSKTEERFGDTNTENTPDPAEIWHREREGRIESDRQRLSAQTALLEQAYGGLENQWNELDRVEEDSHESLNTREIVRGQSEKARLLSEAEQIRNGYTALKQEKEALERTSKLEYNALLENSSPPSQMMLRAYRNKLENDPAAMRKLLFEHNRAVAAQITPDTSDYFRHLESAMGWKDDERQTNFRRSENGASKTKDTKAKEYSLTPEQREFARNLNGITEEEYAKACSQPFSNAANADDFYVDPGLDVDSGREPELTVRFEESAKPEPKRYRAPDPKTSVTLSPAERELISNMAATTGRPQAEVQREFAEQKLRLHSGKSGYQLYGDKLSSSIPSRNR